jgi:hypothetical protein
MSREPDGKVALLDGLHRAKQLLQVGRQHIT